MRVTSPLLAEARRRAQAAGVSITFVEGDLLDVPYPDADFDGGLEFGEPPAQDRPVTVGAAHAGAELWCHDRQG